MDEIHRKIIHVDMDAFYASVEQRDDPQLRGRPVVVGGNPESRGVVASASYEARKFGVRSAMSARRARQICPAAIFVRPQFSKYKEVSQRIREIFFSVTDLVEPLSLDEAYLDVTQNKLGEPLATKIAIHIRGRIKSELRLTASAGVAPNKFLAKLASDLRKPDGLCVIPPDKVVDFVENLPVERLWGVGPRTGEKLGALGIYTTRDVRRCGAEFLRQNFGSFGDFLFRLAHGEDDRRVHSEREPKSRGSETTFEKDVLDKNLLLGTLDELCRDVTESLVKIARRPHTVTVKVRYANFKTITRSRTLPHGTFDDENLRRVAKALLEATDAGTRPIRLLGVSAANFAGGAAENSATNTNQLFLDLD